MKKIIKTLIKKLIKTLALITTGLVVGVGIKRASSRAGKNKVIYGVAKKHYYTPLVNPFIVGF